MGDGSGADSSMTTTTHNEGVRLWLDDVRDPARHGCIGWTWATTADEAIALLAAGDVVEASLDHDLSIAATIGQPCREKTGYDVVLWMEENGVYPPEGVYVHSMNPSGKQRMLAALRALRARLVSDATPISAVQP
jgi:hypothetical protein